MYNGCGWLPEPIKMSGFNYDDEALEKLYQMYISELRDCKFTFREKEVKFRSNPPIEGKEEGFFHIISGYRGRPVDDERAKRMLWGKEILLHTPCPTFDIEQCCEGIWVWKSNNNQLKKERVHIFHPKVNYLVIIEERQNYWSYVTSYRVGNSQKRREFKLEYKKNKLL